MAITVKKSRTSGKFGKLGPRFPAGLKEIDSYASAPLPPPPAAVDWTKNVADWPMDGNDQYGDCTMAAAAHCLQSWNAEAKVTDPVPNEQQVVQTYLQLTGGADNGLVESDVLRTWNTTGLWGNRIVGYAPVNVHNLIILRQAIDLFGGVYVGIQVPANAQQQFADGQAWTLVPGWQNQSIVGGHAVPLLGYDAKWLYCVTWGAVQQIAWDWWHTYGDEAWAILSHAFAEAKVVNGLDVATLQADLASI